LRPQDRGFQECLVLKGGGIGQVSDLPGGSSYFDPVLLHNGKIEKKNGYITNVLTDAAIDFIAAKPDEPFFVYLPFNCPHTPLEVSAEDLKPYKEMKLGLDEFPKVGFRIGANYDEDTTAKIYAMIANIDANLARLFKVLDDKKLAENTIVLFLSDNGPQQPRYNAGLRGLKTTVFEGGIRVPFFARWPGKFPAGKKTDVVAAHIDILPTLLDACGIPLPSGLQIDGISLLRALQGREFAPPDRVICLQLHRADVPEMGRACMARGPRYKIVQPLGVGEGKTLDKTEFELYDIINDPYEQANLAAKQPDVVQEMRKRYETWFTDVTKQRRYEPPRIILGSDRENPSLLTRQDWRGAKSGPRREGYWKISVERPGKYRVTVVADAAAGERTAHVRLGTSDSEAKIVSDRAIIDNLEWKKGDGRLEAWLMNGAERFGVKYLEVERMGD
jgi:hypothetical protein